MPTKFEIQNAMWRGDVDWLYEHAACRCCCAEHTFESCAARLWEGCRGSGTPTRRDLELWAAHYGMTIAEFLNGDPYYFPTR